MRNRVKQVSSNPVSAVQQDVKALQNKITTQGSSVFDVLTGANTSGAQTIALPNSYSKVSSNAFNSSTTNQSAVRRKGISEYPTDFKPPLQIKEKGAHTLDRKEDAGSALQKIYIIPKNAMPLKSASKKGPSSVDKGSSRVDS
jgi:hypothetical protein